MKSGNRFPVFLIRLTLGLLFIVAAVGKLNDMKQWLYGKEVPVEEPALRALGSGTENAVGAPQPVMKRQGGLYDQFAGKLPRWLLVVFGNVLPFVELIGGIWLMTGFFPRWSLRIMGLTLVMLTFGPMLTQQYQLVGQNMIFVFIAATALKWSKD